MTRASQDFSGRRRASHVDEGCLEPWKRCEPGGALLEWDRPRSPKRVVAVRSLPARLCSGGGFWFRGGGRGRVGLRVQRSK